MPDEGHLTQAEIAEFLTVARLAKAKGVDPSALLREAVAYAEVVDLRKAGESFSPAALLREAGLAESEWKEASILAGVRGWDEQASPLPELIERNNLSLTRTGEPDILASPSARNALRLMRAARVVRPGELSKYLDPVANALRMKKRRGGQQRPISVQVTDSGLLSEYVLRLEWLAGAEEIVPKGRITIRVALEALGAANYPPSSDEGLRQDLARHLISQRRSRRRRGGLTLSDQAALWLLELIRQRQGRTGVPVTEDDQAEALRLRERLQKSVRRDDRVNRSRDRGRT